MFLNCFGVCFVPWSNKQVIAPASYILDFNGIRLHVFVFSFCTKLYRHLLTRGSSGKPRHTKLKFEIRYLALSL